MTEITKIIQGGDIVFDIEDPGIVDPIDPPPDPPLPSDTLNFAFAEIPEQVFVSGYTSVDEMNIYHLDPNNLFPSGSMPWDGDNGFVPRLKCDLIAEAGTIDGITWDRDTGNLNYDGTALVADNIIKSFHFNQPDTNIDSMSFEIKLLKATLEWDFTNEISLETAVNTAFGSNTRTENVVLIKAGDYQGTLLRDNGAVSNFNAFLDRGNTYIVGDGSMPKIRGTCSNWADPWSISAVWGEKLKLRFGGTQHVHIKGIDLSYTYIDMKKTIQYVDQISVETVVFNKLKWGSTPLTGDGTQFTPYYSTDPNYLPRFLNNIEIYWMGANGTTHPIYNHSAPYYSEEELAANPKAITYLNNYKAYEMRRITTLDKEIYGGQMYKDFGNRTKIRNSKFSLTKDPSNIANMTEADWEKVSGSPMLVLHSYMQVTMYNNEFHGWNCDTTSNQPTYGDTGKKLYRGLSSFFNYQNRGLSPSWGAQYPPYFSNPSIGEDQQGDCQRESAYGAWENWTYTCDASGLPQSAIKNNRFHGSNDTSNYSDTGEFGDITANTVRPPENAPFWDTIGEVSDPNTTNAFHKYMSHNRFYFYNNVPYALKQCNAVQVHSSVPKDAKQQFNDTKDFLPCPPNWKERNYIFSCNNSFYNFNDDTRFNRFKMGHAEAHRYIYPYAPNQVDVVANNKTEVGGEIVDDAGEQIAIPIWFKI